MKKKVFSLLQGRHWSLNVESFINLGEGTDVILIDIAGDTKTINYLRFRALEALSLFPTEDTATFLEETIETSFTPLARRGFEAYHKGFRKTKPQRVKKIALLLLKHPKENIRISAARAIRSIDKEIFKKFLKSEKQLWVRKEAQK